METMPNRRQFVRGYVHHRDDEVELLARAVLNDLDSAGVLADMLDERDPPTPPYIGGKQSPSRGTLLRARWRKWQKDRVGCNISWRNYMVPNQLRADALFRLYIKARFIVPIRTR